MTTDIDITEQEAQQEQWDKCRENVYVSAQRDRDAAQQRRWAWEDSANGRWAL